ncbi:outer membrane lipoprotein-sorting protein [Chitinibacter tainanensis]|uniref:outer membrane lipoprotein-sorting protein n=1 Tax=Chitinibacter tainanensis TaxID=230667 RepID=UPI00040AE745|nr:outer membrane lipoprotein-sorting protein [Chitinibacter tainanensis]
MFKPLPRYGLLLANALLAASAAAAPTAQSLLATSDGIRNPSQSFALTSTLTEYRNGQQTEQTTLAVYARAEPNTGQYRNLIRFVAPQRDNGKLLLKNGNDLWFFDPASKASVRISPQQRLLGQAANGDVVTVNLAVDYSAQLAGEEAVQDGQQQPRQAYLLKLSAKTPEVTYHRIDYWLDKTSLQPIKARFYSSSDRLLKTAFYRKFEQQLGALRPTETVIIDGLDPKWITVVRSSDWRYRDVPENWLQREYLPNFKAE